MPARKSMLTRRQWLGVCGTALLGGCDRPAGRSSLALLQPPWLKQWTSANIPDQGEVSIQSNALVLKAGQPMTGVRFDGWQQAGLPCSGYTVEYQARRVDGRDFFGALTFPVRTSDTCATLVLGGWGGAVTGISSIDFSDANENQTRSEQRYENGRWYAVKLRVGEGDLQVFLDGRIIVNVSIRGRNISLRAGFIDHCAPFGFASYASTCEVKDLRVQAGP